MPLDDEFSNPSHVKHIYNGPAQRPLKNMIDPSNNINRILSGEIQTPIGPANIHNVCTNDRDIRSSVDHTTTPMHNGSAVARPIQISNICSHQAAHSGLNGPLANRQPINMEGGSSRHLTHQVSHDYLFYQNCLGHGQQYNQVPCLLRI